MKTKSPTSNKSNVVNSVKTTKRLPIMPVHWIIYRNGDVIATPNLAFLVEIYYFPN